MMRVFVSYLLVSVRSSGLFVFGKSQDVWSVRVRTITKDRDEIWVKIHNNKYYAPC